MLLNAELFVPRGSEWRGAINQEGLGQSAKDSSRKRREMRKQMKSVREETVREASHLNQMEPSVPSMMGAKDRPLWGPPDGLPMSRIVSGCLCVFSPYKLKPKTANIK